MLLNSPDSRSTLGDRTVPFPSLPSPSRCVLTARQLCKDRRPSPKSEIKSKKVAARLELQPLQVNNNKHSGAAAGPAAVHGVAGCEVRTTYRSQEKHVAFCKSSPNVVSKSDCVFLSSASGTGGGDGGITRRRRGEEEKEKKKKRMLYFQTMSLKRLQASFATSLLQK